LTESDVIDLSRSNKKSVYEIAYDNESKAILEDGLDKAFDADNNDEIAFYSTLLQIFDESEEYVKKILTPAFEKIQKVGNVCNEQE
jgi:hypothetical protein